MLVMMMMMVMTVVVMLLLMTNVDAWQPVTQFHAKKY